MCKMSDYAPQSLDLHAVYAVLSFLHAHTRAQEEVPSYFGKNDPLVSRIQQQVNGESNHQCQWAKRRLDMIQADTISLAKSKMLSRRLLDLQTDEVRFLKGKGVLTETEASVLEWKINDSMRQLVSRP